MATVSSHILDSVSGWSAAGIRCQLSQFVDNGKNRLIFDVFADEEGRITQDVEIDDTVVGSEFELVFFGADYFARQSIKTESAVSVVVIRFVMDDDEKRYHMPVMLSPHSYSTWWSA